MVVFGEGKVTDVGTEADFLSLRFVDQSRVCSGFVLRRMRRNLTAEKQSTQRESFRKPHLNFLKNVVNTENAGCVSADWERICMFGGLKLLNVTIDQH